MPLRRYRAKTSSRCDLITRLRLCTGRTLLKSAPSGRDETNQPMKEVQRACRCNRAGWNLPHATLSAPSVAGSCLPIETISVCLRLSPQVALGGAICRQLDKSQSPDGAKSFPRASAVASERRQRRTGGARSQRNINNHQTLTSNIIIPADSGTAFFCDLKPISMRCHRKRFLGRCNSSDLKRRSVFHEETCAGGVDQFTSPVTM